MTNGGRAPEDTSVPPSIAAGLPVTRAGWPPEVLEAVKQFVAGDVVDCPPLFYFADPRYAVWEATKDYAADSEGPEIIDAAHVAPRYGVITAQTCDLGEIDFDPPAKPWISISPVYDMTALEGQTRSLLRQGKGPLHLVYLPVLSSVNGGFWVADLRIEVPVEKSWLVGRSPIKSFENETAQRVIVDRVARLRERPAWAAVVTEVVQATLMDELKSLKSADRDLFEACNTEIAEVGARTDSMLNPTFVQLTIFCQNGPSSRVRDWWAQVVDIVRERTASRGLAVHAGGIEALSECSVGRYREFEPVPLTRFSPA